MSEHLYLIIIFTLALIALLGCYLLNFLDISKHTFLSEASTDVNNFRVLGNIIILFSTVCSFLIFITSAVFWSGVLK